MINLDGALEIMEGDYEILISVIEAFLEEAPMLGRQLHVAIEQNDAVTAQRAAHTLKGGLRTLQLESLQESWGHIEQMAQDGRLDEIAAPLKEAERKTAVTLDQLRLFVAKHSK